MCMPLQICLGALVGFVINKLAILSEALNTVLIRPRFSELKRSSRECETAYSKSQVVSSFALTILFVPGGIVIDSRVAILTFVNKGRLPVPKFSDLFPIQIFPFGKSKVTVGNVFSTSHPIINW
ncbi:unnamed protein product [Meloidogyne enterolobii]|uniref:Uncharacterized protein n=1 Tax=Meloidogyne enterolobii TaxID=390850 RepID=A0ACB0YWY9_MELEN